MKKIFRLLIVLVIAFALFGCDKKESVVTISTVGDATQVKKGEKLVLKATITPSQDGATFTWEVNNPSVATIKSTGTDEAELTGVSSGRVKVTVKTSTGLENNKNIQVKDASDIDANYPDLQGYTIKVAQAGHALGEYDVFIEKEDEATYGYYSGADRSAKQQAWRDVEEDFNCFIEIVAYPADAPWGPNRWNYIKQRAMIDDPEFDFYVVPDAQIADFVNSKALVDLTSWYDTYGADTMSNMNKTAGTVQQRLYSINTADINIYNVLCYNINLWKKINEVDPTILEPAKMFNDGNWSYSVFKDYCAKAQTVLDGLFPANTEETKGDKHYVLSGSPSYYWVGMLDRNGKGAVNMADLKVDISSADAVAAADTMKAIYAGGAMDPDFGVDQGVETWNGGKALFDTGDLWFVNASNRWNSILWGEGTTLYGYVPFPAPDGYDTTHTYVGSTSEACMVMAAGRQKVYSTYGITEEDVYHAFMEYWVRAKKYYIEAPDYNKETQMNQTAEAKFGSEESRKAYITVSKNIEKDGFYDPLVSAGNQIMGTWGTKFDLGIRGYINGTGAATWADAVGSFQTELNDNTQKAFG